MKLLASISLFAVASLAAKYSPGTNCHTNIECNDNCQDSSWTIMSVDGDYQLVCDPTKGDPTQYYKGDCFTYEQALRGVDIHEDPEGSKKACDQVGGTFCNGDCFLSGKRSAQGDTSGAWDNACKAAGSEGSLETYVTASSAAARGKQCDVNTVFPNVKRDIAFEA